MARLHLGACRRFDRPADAHPGVREEHVLRPAAIDDRLLAHFERVLPERQGLRDLLGQYHPLPKEQAVTRVGHDALVELPDGVELLLRDLHEARHEVARTWDRTIKVVRTRSARKRFRCAGRRTEQQSSQPHARSPPRSDQRSLGSDFHFRRPPPDTSISMADERITDTNLRWKTTVRVARSGMTRPAQNTGGPGVRRWGRISEERRPIHGPHPANPASHGEAKGCTVPPRCPPA